MPAESFIEKRIRDRFPVGMTCVLSVDGRQTPCMTRDVSTGGVRVTPKDIGGLHKGAKITIEFEELGVFKAEIAWVAEADIGVRFEKDPSEMTNMVETMVLYG
ncbi:MAG: PilZ domain-containing protein [Rhodospirillales bacterium]